MRRPLSLAVASLAGFAALVPAAEAGDRARRYAEPLPPEVRDPRPRLRPPVAAYAVRAYVPRPTYQPMFNEPPQPLR
ncbi:MAG: hypothetical protein PGN25_05145 [Methylorubrum populi]